MGQRIPISFVGPSYHPKSCYGPHTVFFSLRIRGNVTHRSGAQVIPCVAFQWRAVERLPVDDLTRLEELWESAVIQSAKQQQAMRWYHAWNICSRSIQVGDFVLWKIQMTKHQHKISPTWEGPYEVVEMTRPGSYRLQREDGYEVQNSWNDDQLRPFYM
jgi:hypothetical protein